MKQWKLGWVMWMVSGSLYAAPLPVVASFSILGDVAQQIGGERVAVDVLVGADQDSHAYHMTAADVQKIRAAKLVLVNGLGLENAELKRAAVQNNIPYVEAAAGISAVSVSDVHAHEGHGHDQQDPHVWNDPLRMFKYAANIANAFSRVDPAGKSYYQRQLQAYQQQLKQLHIDAVMQFSAIPKQKRTVLTGHDSFGYMGKRYGIRFIAPQGMSTETEPSAKEVAAIIRQIKGEQVRAVFAENIKDDRMVKRIAAETGVQVQGKLYSDALSQSGAGKTYLEMYRYNIRMLGKAMQ